MTRRTELPQRLASGSFTLGEARAAGVTESRLEAADLIVPSRGIRIPRGASQTLAQRSAPYVKLSPQAVLSHGSALQLRGLPCPRVVEADQRLHLTTPLDTAQIRRRGVAGHRAALAAGEIVTVDGVQTTSPARTFLDIAATEGVTLEELVVLGDALVCEHVRSHYPKVAIIKLAVLTAAVQGAAGRRGAARAREALALVRLGADSPRETLLRLALVRSGLPEPEVAYLVEGEAGEHTYVDLAFPEYRVAVDYDGRHHLTPEQQNRDAMRAQELANAGWRLVLITKVDLRKGARWTALRVADVLRRQGWVG